MIVWTNNLKKYWDCFCVAMDFNHLKGPVDGGDMVKWQLGLTACGEIYSYFKELVLCRYFFRCIWGLTSRESSAASPKRPSL